MKPEAISVIAFTDMKIASTWLGIDLAKAEKKIKELLEKLKGNKK
jgi:hypothetical protein